MNNVLSLIVTCLLILVTESVRHRRQYGGYNNAQQYGSQYGIYNSGGQGWPNNVNPYQPGYGSNSNFYSNQINRRPEWYYNTANTIQSSFLYFLLILFYILVI